MFKLHAAALAAVTLAAASSLAQGELVPQAEIESIYLDKVKGSQLYRAKKYDKAVPHLKNAAERGFKESQAQLGSIYALGLGGVEQNIAEGVGWLGVAASGETTPRIRKTYEEMRAGIPAQHNEQLDAIVDQFIANYDGRKTRVNCKLVRRAGRNIKATRCRFIDEGNYPALSLPTQ